MLGIRTQGGRMDGADESTELWQHPINTIFSHRNFSRKSSATKTFTSGRRASATDVSASTRRSKNDARSRRTSYDVTWPPELRNPLTSTLTPGKLPSKASSRPLPCCSRRRRNRFTTWWSLTVSADSWNPNFTRKASWPKWVASRWSTTLPRGWKSTRIWISALPATLSIPNRRSVGNRNSLITGANQKSERILRVNRAADAASSRAGTTSEAVPEAAKIGPSQKTGRRLKNSRSCRSRSRWRSWRATARLTTPRTTARRARVNLQELFYPTR